MSTCSIHLVHKPLACQSLLHTLPYSHDCYPHMLSFLVQPLPSSHTELDALGDDFLADEDTSYLDDTVNAPEPPTTVPGGTERTRVSTALVQVKHCMHLCVLAKVHFDILTKYIQTYYVLFYANRPYYIQILWGVHFEKAPCVAVSFTHLEHDS